MTELFGKVINFAVCDFSWNKINAITHFFYYFSLLHKDPQKTQEAFSFASATKFNEKKNQEALLTLIEQSQAKKLNKALLALVQQNQAWKRQEALLVLIQQN